MIKILILDDDEILFMEQPDWMTDPSPFKDAEITQVNSVKAFFEVFDEDPNWDEIWVDNDLGPDATFGNSGMGLSKRLAHDYHGNLLTTVGAFRVTTMNNTASCYIADNLFQICNKVIMSPIFTLKAYGVCRGDTFISKQIKD